ncbi:MAG: pyridoxal phosphate-dependent aminotransferase [Anaerolineales bacterium]|nr:pyridoxal phosphate-dependent aminotransferase [Anaerolineales bacterium]MCB0013081.1 pyridoxal phosphate-dependent aminotransferase [Anaerolineales bacterium]MCB0030337.1 pyridoxal phosphate-dependent aminotransferase [Anaerolineales bacterium]
MKYNFDEIVDRKGTHSMKWEAGEFLKAFGLTERFDEDTISLFVADMDFPVPEPIIRAMHERVDRRIFGYSNFATSPDYVEAIQGWFRRRHDWLISEESIVYSSGTVSALHNMVKAYTEPGDGIMIQRPVYFPFTAAIEGNNRVVVNNALINNDGYYTIDFDDFEAKAKEPSTKMFILCNPHNPVGRVFTAEELTKMAEICIENDVIFIGDEIHGDLIRPDQTHHPILTLVDDPRIISCTAINKTFNTAGLHCSNIIINDQEMRDKFKAIQGFTSPTPFAIVALIAAYNEGEDWLQQVNAYIDDNLKFLDTFLKENMPQVKYVIPEGTYIGWLDFRGYGLTSKEVHDRIYNQANVVLEDGEIFGPEGEGFQRICVPTPRPLFKQALERIAAQF